MYDRLTHGWAATIGTVTVRQYDEYAQFDPLGYDPAGGQLMTRWTCHVEFNVNEEGRPDGWTLTLSVSVVGERGRRSLN